MYHVKNYIYGHTIYLDYQFSFVSFSHGGCLLSYPFVEGMQPFHASLCFLFICIVKCNKQKVNQTSEALTEKSLLLTLARSMSGEKFVKGFIKGFGTELNKWLYKQLKTHIANINEASNAQTY